MTNPNRRRYPSDLTDHQWARFEAELPPEPQVGRHRSIPLRDIANAINYRWETGCTWRMLPHDFPPWGTVYAYFQRWQRAGLVRHLREILLSPRTRPPRRFSLSKTNPTWPSGPHSRPTESTGPDATSNAGFDAPDPPRESYPGPTRTFSSPLPE